MALLLLGGLGVAAALAGAHQPAPRPDVAGIGNVLVRGFLRRIPTGRSRPAPPSDTRVVLALREVAHPAVPRRLSYRTAWDLAPDAPPRPEPPVVERREGAVPVTDLPVARSVSGALSLVPGVDARGWAGEPLARSIDGGPAWTVAPPAPVALPGPWGR
jgi:hypothetical protein